MLKEEKPNNRDYVRLAVALAKMWHLRFGIYPFSDFLKSGMWCAKFDSILAYSSVFPLTGTQSGKSVESAARKLVEAYIRQYGDKTYPIRIRSVEELELRLVAMGI